MIDEDVISILKAERKVWVFLNETGKGHYKTTVNTKKFWAIIPN
jgi:hypothetical protein